MDHLIGAANFNGAFEIATDLLADEEVDAPDLALMKRDLIYNK